MRYIVLLVAAIGACHSDLPAARTAARMPLHVLDKAATGTRIATLPRPTRKVVRLSLFIDAGSRDATPPQAATLAAWIAAQSGGPQIEATVYPDVTELAMSCESDALSRCLPELARALSTRDPSETALTQARDRLRDGQRRTLAHDPGQSADLLAARALLGDAAADGFFALGSPSSDLIAAAAAVPGFLRNHYGPARTLLVAAGDAEPTHVREAVVESFGKLAQAALPRNPRSLTPSDAPKLLVEFDSEAGAAVAIAGHDEAQLNAVVASLSAAVARAELRIELSGNVFSVRGGALALLRIRSSDAELALEHVTRELARLKLEPASIPTQSVVSDDLVSISRRFGIDFGAEGTAGLQRFELGGGLLLSNTMREQEPDEAARSEHAQAMFTRAVAQAEPRTRGDIDQYVASVVIDNGARIDVQFAQGSQVAIAIRVAAGADQDSPLLHGQSALVATLTTLSCAGMGPELLRSRFAHLGATLDTRVDAESYGLLLRTPKETWQQALDLALRCMRAPSHDPRYLPEAALQLQSRLRRQAGALGLRASAANLVTPRAPGELAPWGDPERIGNVTGRDLLAALQSAEQGARWAVGIVGPVPVRAAMDWTARRIADLPAGALPKPTQQANIAVTLPTEAPRSNDARGAKLVAVWRVHGKFQHPFGALLFARAVGALLSAVDGVEVLWHDGDVHGGTGFAALALRVRADLGPQLGPLLQGAARSIDDAWLTRAISAAMGDAIAGQNAADAQLAVRAEHVARTRLGASFGQPSEQDARDLLQALRASQPGWTLVR